MTKRADNDDVLNGPVEPLIPDGLADRIIAQATALPQQEKKSEKPYWIAAMAGLAATVVAAFFLLPQFSPNNLTTITTAAGETRTIDLADNSSITLNGATQLVLEEGRDRFARLVDGEAIFTIEHDDEAPFIIETEGFRLVDKGTIFNVRKIDDELSVAVSEGLVSIESGAEPILLRAGKALSFFGGRPAHVTDIETATVGSWSQGLLTFELAAMDVVAADLTRVTGIEISLAPSLKEQKFSGVISVHEEKGQLKDTLTQLLGVTVSDTETGWSFSH